MHRLCAAAVLLLAAAAVEARELRIGVSQAPNSLNPILEASLAQQYVNGFVRRPITIYDHSWQLVCGLCVELPTFDNGLAKLEALPNGEQGVAVTYQLNPQATWGDGTPVTADDVVAAWEVSRDPSVPSVPFELYRHIRSIDVHDEKTFTLHLDRADYTYNVAPLELIPAHIERPLFEADPASWGRRSTFDADPSFPGLFMGPYKIVQVTPGVEIVLETNPTWYGKPPAFERIRLVVLPNTATLEVNLLSGDIDMIAGELGLQVDQALSFEGRHANDYKVIHSPTTFFEHLDLNLEQPGLADQRVRQALLYALDRERLTQQLFKGLNPVALSNVPPLSPYLAQDLPTYPYDPAKATQLLQDAGWTPGKDGVLVNAKGERLSLRYATTAGDRTRELVQQVLQAQWKAIGIETLIENQIARVFFGQTVEQGRFDVAQFAWTIAPEFSWQRILRSSGGNNYTHYSNPEMDRLIDAFEREFDSNKRRAISAEMQQLYLKDLPVLPLYWRTQSFVLPLWLSGLRPTGHNIPTTVWVEEWQVAE